MVAVEVMINTPTVAKLIEEGRTSQIYGAMNEGGYWGMQTMNQSLIKYWRAGVVTEEDAMTLRRQQHRTPPDAPARRDLRSTAESPHFLHASALLLFLPWEVCSERPFVAQESKMRRVGMWSVALLLGLAGAWR